ncbi:hypothetical protein CMQ_3756 [Grosmannia clavigera kw1407]|uniref:P-loop containing nucleoside triphosphate hydrolase protein n=1 Tax=Grosmannia clavigera (strain kw1407 / UAMH 11150) TaxID=655863 RepID=F0X9J7_GROCL|nr:uncharacterized protein CMQ_3756 [Grosmannia clavigera kw1407]EFX05687.1 hypothetical protein CMQ_3756 [Grosmannia clavigera kw1407]
MAKKGKSNKTLSNASPGFSANSSNSTPASTVDLSLGGDPIPPHLEKQILYLTISTDKHKRDEIAASPLLTVPALDAGAPTQYGVIGRDSSKSGQSFSSLSMYKRHILSMRIFQNVSAPSSTFICGSQGSGKSNTLACLLENCLLPSDLGNLPHPLTGIVFHYDSFNSDLGGIPCEAAYLASNKNVKVRILCSPTNVRTITLSDRDLTTTHMHDLMTVGESGMPLYMHVVDRVLRELKIEQDEQNLPFNYEKFKRRIFQSELTSMQTNPLKQRLDTLESFMPRNDSNKKTPGTASGNDWTAKPGQLTVVDLSCPCVTPDMACWLFKIALQLFLKGDMTTGRIVALDEAHKYMRDTSGGSRALTERLLEVVRNQRHQGARVIISTQEPTVSPKLLDLCSVTVVHRFTSPDWLHVLQGHLAGLSPITALVGDTNVTADGEEHKKIHYGAQPIDLMGRNNAMELFGLIVGLETGQALVFSPSTIVGIKDDQGGGGGTTNGNNKKRDAGSVERLGNRALLVNIRARMTEDGGRSIMAL